MTNDDTEAEKPTATDAQELPLIEVDVSRETAREAARIADEDNLAIEDALVRLTAFDYPPEVLSTQTPEQT